MNAMPIDRVPTRDYKPQVNAHMSDGEYYLVQGARYHDGRESLN